MRPPASPILLFLTLTASLVAVPGAAGQDAPEVDTPDGQQVEGTGPPTAQESLEEGPGISYGVFLLVGIVVFMGAFGYAAWRYAKRPPSP